MNSFPWKQRLSCRAGYHFNQSLRVVRFIAAKGPEIIFCFSWMMIILFLFLDQVRLGQVSFKLGFFGYLVPKKPRESGASVFDAESVIHACFAGLQ